MSARAKQSEKLRYLCLLGLFIAIELMMKLSGLGSVPVGPLVMSFLTVPIAVGAILLGPLAGAIMGATFGIASLIDAIQGVSLMTNAFFAVNPASTVVLCVGTRTLMGACVGWIYKALDKIDRTNVVKYFVSALSAALLNTIFFMGYIVLFFYQTDFVQNLAANKGAVNPLMFIVLVVGVQGLIEAIACTVVGGGVAKGVDVALNRKHRKSEKTPEENKK